MNPFSQIDYGDNLRKRQAVIFDGALDRKATVGANRERHRGLTGWRILGGIQMMAQGPKGELVVFLR